MGQTLIELKNISKTFPGVKALENIGFSIDSGEIHALIGENGAGKSTLIKILSGVYQPDSGGQIILGGRVVESLTPLEALQSEIAVIYQDFSLFPNLSVMENIALEQSVKNNDNLVDWKAMERISRDALDQLGISLDLNTILGDLSIAKQQLVAIARSLANNARLLILDEPTSSLSKNEVRKLFDIMHSLKNKGMALLFISHKIDELFAISDKFTILRDGKYIGTYGEDELDDEQLISLMVGRKIEYTIYPKNKRTEPLLEVRGFSKKGNFRDINFTLHKGEILGLTGLVGAGRTEVAQAIFGLNPADEGTLLLDGKEIINSTPNDAVKAGFSFVPENRLQEGLVLSKSIEDNISLTMLDALSGKSSLINLKKRKELTRNWMEKMDIRPNIPEMITSKLSGGNQQRVVISKWLATDPKVLIVDEPTNGIDIGAKSGIHQLLRDLAEKGLGIIIISSELPEILAIADRVAVMRRGRIITEFFCENITQEDIMSKAL
ncbi:MAG: sugar ABC transporter ATP-binding protein [Spirochaetes bacterium]|nr:MAG: sugar ABC transporter ATP-binding protein [Spirochaetota bacterium]